MKMEAGYIAEELLQSVNELHEKCKVIKQTVEDGDFTLEEALCAYEVSINDYNTWCLS